VAKVAFRVLHFFSLATRASRSPGIRSTPANISTHSEDLLC